MAISQQLKNFLEHNGIPYQVLPHPPAPTAWELARALHVPGDALAKVVLLVIDDRYVMAVVPSTRHVDLQRLSDVLGHRRVRLAAERELSWLFPDCEIGAMPPFGNLYGLQVFMDSDLSDEADIVFQAGSSCEAVRMLYWDFVTVVQPTIFDFHRKPAHAAS